jgi:hypothetical protein
MKKKLVAKNHSAYSVSILSAIDESIKGGMGWPTFVAQGIDILSGNRLAHAPKHFRDPHQRVQVFQRDKGRKFFQRTRE